MRSGGLKGARHWGIPVLGGLLVAGLILFATGRSPGSTGAAQRTASAALRAAESPPQAVFDTLKKMNRKLQRMIDEDSTGGDLEAEVKGIHNVKEKLVEDDFAGQTVFGVAFHKVFLKLESIDVLLVQAVGSDDQGHDEATRIRIKHAKKEKERLEKLLKSATGVPDGVFDTLKKMNRKLQRMIDEDSTGGGLEAEVKGIHNVKEKLVEDDFAGQTVFGVAFHKVFLKLESIDVLLVQAVGSDDQGHDEATRIRIKHAKKEKERLEKLLREAQEVALDISPINALFVSADRATYYTVPTVTNPTGGAITYKWTLSLQAVDPNKGVDNGCVNARGGGFTGTATQFMWAHGNIGDTVHDDGCDHSLEGQYGHQGLITVEVTDSRGWKCTATYKGTKSSGSVADAASNPSCTAPSG